MGVHETEASFDATASESGAVVNHEGKKPLKKSKLLLAVLYFGMQFVRPAQALTSASFRDLRIY